MKTRKKLFELNKALQSAKVKGNNAFKLKVIKNINLIKPEIEALIEIEKQNDETLKPYQKTVSELFERYAETKVNEQGEQKQSIPAAKLAEFNERYAKLKAKNKELIEGAKTIAEDFVKMINEEKQEFAFAFNHVSESDAEFTAEELEAFIEWGILDETAN
jgi:hypothetical protein